MHFVALVLKQAAASAAIAEDCSVEGDQTLKGWQRCLGHWQLSVPGMLLQNLRFVQVCWHTYVHRSQDMAVRNLPRSKPAVRAICVSSHLKSCPWLTAAGRCSLAEAYAAVCAPASPVVPWAPAVHSAATRLSSSEAPAGQPQPQPVQGCCGISLLPLERFPGVPTVLCNGVHVLVSVLVTILLTWHQCSDVWLPECLRSVQCMSCGLPLQAPLANLWANRANIGSPTGTAFDPAAEQRNGMQ